MPRNRIFEKLTGRARTRSLEYQATVGMLSEPLALAQTLEQRHGKDHLEAARARRHADTQITIAADRLDVARDRLEADVAREADRRHGPVEPPPPRMRRPRQAVHNHFFTRHPPTG